MSEWIDATKQLPKADGRYLVCYGSVFIATFTTSTKQWKKEYFENGLDQLVTHWMPLPEAPKK